MIFSIHIGTKIKCSFFAVIFRENMLPISFDEFSFVPLIFEIIFMFSTISIRDESLLSFFTEDFV